MNRKKLEIIAAVILIATFVFTLSGSLKKVRSKLKAKAGASSSAVTARQSPAQADAVSKEKVGLDIKEEVYGQSDRDPFAPPETPQTAVSGISSLRLTGITTNGAGKEIAIINEEIVPVGGKIGKFTVMNISSKKVTVTDGQETSELKLAE